MFYIKSNFGFPALGKVLLCTGRFLRLVSCHLAPDMKRSIRRSFRSFTYWTFNCFSLSAVHSNNEGWLYSSVLFYGFVFVWFFLLLSLPPFVLILLSCMNVFFGLLQVTGWAPLCHESWPSGHNFPLLRQLMVLQLAQRWRTASLPSSTVLWWSAAWIANPQSQTHYMPT